MKTSKSLQRHLFMLAASAAALGGVGHALACQFAAGTSDTALTNTFPIPTFLSAKDFIARQAIDFDMLPDSWTGHGFEAADDTRFEYTKHWMSSYLIANGHVFEHRVTGTGTGGQKIDLLLDRAFHTPSDYYVTAKGEPTLEFPDNTLTVSHDRFVSLLGADDPNKLGEWVFSEHPPASAVLFWPLALFPETTETVTTFCGLYDVQDSETVTVSGGPPIGVFLPNSLNIYGTPSERASDLVHEGTHARNKDDSARAHVSCDTGQRDEGGSCDLFFPHLKSDFSGGDLAKGRFPAYELQLEYLCDLVDEAQDWVPLALLSDAEGTADRTAKFHFVDSTGRVSLPPFSCGVPSPMMAEPPVAGCDSSVCGGQKDGTACSDGICVSGCCQVVR